MIPSPLWWSTPGRARSLVLVLLSAWFALARAESVVPMPVISHGVPAYASGSAPWISPSVANDGIESSMWVSDTVPAWIAYDLSGVPVAQRQQALVAWYASWALGYNKPSPTPDLHLPTEYFIEVNPAPGGTAAPATGWQTVVAVTGNTRSTPQHLVALGGASWVRLRATASSDPNAIALDFDVHAAPDGASDSWLFMGDSITGMAAYLFSKIPAQVHARAPGRWPAVIPAAVGGSNTGSAQETLDANLVGFPGRYVVLAYGTNDGDSDAFSASYEALVLKVLAAGKIPVIPHMPWSAIPAILAKGPALNARIDALYAKYPAIVRGPDLWWAFAGRTDLIPEWDVHPNGAGNDEMRRQWAIVMATLDHRVAAAFPAWIDGYFPANTAEPQVVGSEADPDGDGYVNWMEYALGQRPHRADPSVALSIWTDAATGERFPRITFPRLTDRTKATVVVETSTDLATWSSAAADVVEVGAPVVSDDTLRETVSVQATAPLSVSARRYFRLRANLP